MIAEILNAVTQECKLFLANSGGTIILKTDYSPKKIEGYTMPLLIIEMLPASEAYQYAGGVSRVDWMFKLNSYNYMPDSMIDDDSGYSRDLLQVIDDIRQHFSNGIWLNTTVTPTMVDVLNAYCFKFTLSNVQNADPLDGEGLNMGYGIVFDSCGVDVSTSTTQESTQVLATVNQINNPPFN
jgi:hypothetical protein